MDSDDDQVYRQEGYLLKLGEKGLLKTYKKRYFRLANGQLTYSRTPTSEALGSIGVSRDIDVFHLVSAASPSKSSRAKSHSWSFILRTKQRTYTLVASSEVEMLYWIDGLRQYRDVVATHEEESGYYDEDDEGEDQPSSERTREASWLGSAQHSKGSMTTVRPSGGGGRRSLSPPVSSREPMEGCGIAGPPSQTGSTLSSESREPSIASPVPLRLSDGADESHQLLYQRWMEAQWRLEEAAKEAAELREETEELQRHLHNCLASLRHKDDQIEELRAQLAQARGTHHRESGTAHTGQNGEPDMSGLVKALMEENERLKAQLALQYSAGPTKLRERDQSKSSHAEHVAACAHGGAE